MKLNVREVQWILGAVYAGLMRVSDMETVRAAVQIGAGDDRAWDAMERMNGLVDAMMPRKEEKDA